VQQSPGHGAHLVEEVKGRPGAPDVDRSRPGSYAQSGTDDPEVTMHPLTTVSPTAARCRCRCRWG